MQRFKNVLVYMGTEENGTAINRAVRLANENHAQLTFMDVIKPMPAALTVSSERPDTADVQALIVEEHLHRLGQITHQCDGSGLDIKTIVKIGDPAVEIVRQVLRHNHDLVIKTADGLSTVGRLFGSVARSLMRLCPCPVWVLKPEIHGELDTVLAAVDVDAGDAKHVDLNRSIISVAGSIAARENANLHVVCAWDLWMESSLRRHAGNVQTDSLAQAHEQKTTAALDQLVQQADLDCNHITTHVSRGAPSRVIQSVADRIEADLLVMGTVCRTGVAGFMIGNTAESLLTDLTCSVLALKPAGFKSPVELSDPKSEPGHRETPPSLV